MQTRSMPCRYRCACAAAQGLFVHMQGRLHSAGVTADDVVVVQVAGLRFQAWPIPGGLGNMGRRLSLPLLATTRPLIDFRLMCGDGKAQGWDVEYLPLLMADGLSRCDLCLAIRASLDGVTFQLVWFGYPFQGVPLMSWLPFERSLSCLSQTAKHL